MNALTLMIGALVLFSGGYRLYGRFVSRTFGVDVERPTPAVTKSDGNDFVAAPNWWVLFGHHFSSICGAGPIVGPALACAYWGWGVSVIWVLIGGLLMGAVADFSSLLISVRSRGESIAKISGGLISERVRKYFTIFIWISLVLVIAVFAIFAAKTFIKEPDAVVPSVGLIPVALLTGWLLYRRKGPNGLVTLLGLGLLAMLLVLGRNFEVVLPGFAGLNAQQTWIILLLIYCFVASVIPVNVLLQPRDYLASFILVGMIGLGVVSIFISRPEMQGDAFVSFRSTAWPEAGPLWPMLFVTIACGAISGFHSLVSSGTTCKQIATEAHACRIGYGGMLTESLVGVLVIIAVSAGLQFSALNELLKSGGPIAAFSHGYGNLCETLLGGYGKSFAVLALNAFILTTLDTAARITRYMTSELFGVDNKYLAALITVVAAGLLALSGKWNLLWPVFGASNQLIAAIALLIGACWLMSRGRRFQVTFLPACFMILTTVAAFAYQFFQALLSTSESGAWSPNWMVAALAAGLIYIGVVIFIEGISVIRRRSETGPQAVPGMA